MKKVIAIGLCILIIMMIAFTAYMSWNYSFNDHNVIVTVTDKERVVNFNRGESKYLIMGEDEQGNPVVYENTDNFFRGKFDSSTFQAGINIGCKYQFTVIGIRAPYYSVYENIIAYKELDSGGNTYGISGTN